MALRLLEIVTSAADAETVRALLEEETVHGMWSEPLAEQLVLSRALLEATDTEAVVDRLDRRLGFRDEFRIMLLPVEATLPRPKEPEPEPEPEVDEEPAAAPVPKRRWTVPRINREELHSQLSDSARPGVVYLALAGLSALVAAIGLMRDNATIIIGAMVIAPLLGPNMAQALGTTLGDMKLFWQAVRTNLYGAVTAFIVALLCGLLLHIDAATINGELLARTEVGAGDILLALASGIAGVLAFTSGASATLIGVMVAVALVPPLTTVGLLAASGEQKLALGAAMLLVTNVVCINLAGVATFLALGVAPARWWEAKKARRATIRAVILWVVLLCILTAVIRFAAV